MTEQEATDALDTAIAAADAPKPVQMLEGRVQLADGRLALFALPVDLSDAEWIGVLEQLLRGHAEIQRRRMGPASRIILPGR